jgi:hypothetical protein
MVNPTTKRFGFILQGQTAMYSYYTEAEMTAKWARQNEQESIANQRRAEQSAIQDNQTKISINAALDGKEYFMALGKLPQKLKRLKVEFVNVEAYEKIKVYGVTDRGHFEAAGSWSKYQ